MEITKSEFNLYEGIRESGVTNMFSVNIVKDLTGLSKTKIIAIMQQYSELKDKYGE